MSSTRFVVGKNDNGCPGDRKGPYYPVVHIESCYHVPEIIAKSRAVFFDNYEEAKDKATEQRPGDCCKRKIKQELAAG